MGKSDQMQQERSASNIGKDLEVKPAFFHLKQFSINQTNAALKVTTEALILGGYAAATFEKASNILDIGTGTGLLALMLAQKLEVEIDAVEIEDHSYLRARENIEKSKFHRQITVHHKSIQTFESLLKYDLIISNPPFYSDHLKSEKTEKNLALHAVELSFSDLAAAVKKFLNSNGKFIVLLPPYQMSQLEKELKLKKLIKTNEFRIHHRENSKVLRIIATFEYNMQDFQTIDFFIKDYSDNYTNQFIALLKEYYLIFD